MDIYKILIINNNHKLNLPSESEIQSFLPAIQIDQIENIADCASKLRSADYRAVVVCAKIDKADAERLGNAICLLTMKPSIIIIGENRVDRELFEDELNELILFIRNDEKLLESLAFALDAAAKRFKLVRQIALLEEKLRQTKINQNIVDLTLSYNSEINNILTAMIGNIQLILKTSNDIGPYTMDKLMKIDENAQRILKMASCLIDIINAPSESLPIGEF